MTGLTIVAVVLAWFSGFGMCYGALKAAGEDREMGKWIGRFCALASVVFTILALRLKP